VREQSIEDLLRPSPLVASSQVAGVAGLLASSGEPLSIMFGETYDEHGLPVDALKYYSWLTVVASELSKRREVTANVVVADLAVALNKGRLWGEAVVAGRAARRMAAVSTFSRLCATPSAPVPVLMSELVVQEGFRARRALAQSLLATSDEFREAVVGSVRSDHLAAEEAGGFRYSLDEVALVAAYDVKVGPPREQFYDRAACVLNRCRGGGDLVSVHLGASYPLGVTPGEYVKNRELREFGVTAYKAGSLGFSKFRLVVGRDDGDVAERLVGETRLLRNPAVPNAITELATVLQTVQWAIEGSPAPAWLKTEWEQQRLSDEELRHALVGLYRKYIDGVVAPAMTDVISD